MNRRRLPSLTSIRNFEAVARNQSFTRAADELCVTQGAVSHQIRVIEEELGTKLLIRGRVGIELTDSGRRLLNVAKRELNKLAEISAQIRAESKHNRAVLRIEISPQFSQFWLASRITSYSIDHPEVEIRVSYCWADSSHQATEGTALMIVPGGNVLSNEYSDRLFSSDLVPLCSPSLKNSLLENNPDNVLLCETEHDWWSDWNADVGEKNAILGQRIWFDDPTIAVHVALAGKGILLGSPYLLKNYLDQGLLVAPLSAELRVSRAYHLIYNEKMISSPHAQSFRTWLLSQVQNEH